jgi:hypothetical protein
MIPFEILANTNYQHGYMCHDAINEAYRSQYPNLSDLNRGVCTLSYNPNGTRLFTGGGPLQMGLSGSFASLW